jgi:hypothetical protein
VFAVALLRRTPPQQQLVVIPAAPAPGAASAPCRALLAALPAQLGHYHRATPAEPTPPGAAAWQAAEEATEESGGPEGDTVVLRCGLERPDEFVVGSPLQMVDAVQWFQISDAAFPGSAAPGTVVPSTVVPSTVAAASTWFAVDRGVYVALTLPADSGPTPIQELSEVIARTMPEAALDPGPPPG